MPPMTVETEPLDVAVATEAVDEPTLKLHDGDDAADVVVDESTGEVVVTTSDDISDEAAASIASNAASVDYDDAVVGVAVEDSKPLDKADGDGKQLHEVKVVVAGPTPRRSAADDSTTLAKIAEAAEEVRYWREQQALLKEQAKEAKENLQGAVNRLMRLSTEVANDSARPLLAAAESKTESSATSETPARTYQGDPVDPLADAPGSAAVEPAPATPLPDPSTEAWRSYRFDDPDHFPSLASQKAIVAKLAEAGIETIGGMIDFQKPGEGGYCKSITDIKGIGAGKAEKIENALEQFWADNPNLVQSAVDDS